MVPAAVHYTVAVHTAAVLRVVTCDQCWADVRGTGEFNGGVKWSTLGRETEDEMVCVVTYTTV